ncbi:MAG: sigma 54-interacting transcriptional regulator [Nitrospira sp.]
MGIKSDTDHISTAFNVLKEAVFVYDQNRVIKRFNQAAERITGFSKDEVIGRKCVTLFKKSVCLGNCDLCMVAKKSQEPIRFESRFYRKDAQERFGEFNVGLLNKEEDGQLEVLVALTDITEAVELRNALTERTSFHKIIGKSRSMKALYKTVKNTAYFDSTILLQGETGTGKELIAQAIHVESPRRNKKLVRVNCASFSDTLLESELFGHARGAFTGAIKDRIGRFEEGDGGTVFLDEIGDLSLNIQVKLLRVLQEKEIERVGENRSRKTDFRLIVASNKNLGEEVSKGHFRKDLFYRLNVIPICIPPLRERKDDIPYLSKHFMNRWQGRSSKEISSISDNAMGKLMDYDWPGNIRELENTIEYSCVKCTDGTIHVPDLPYLISSSSVQETGTRKPRKKISKEMIVDAMIQADGNKSEAARQLGLHRVTLWRKMQHLEIASPL